MSTTETPIVPVEAPKPKKRGKLLLVVSAVLLAALGAAGWLWHRSAAAQSQQETNADTEVKSVLHLESFVVNLPGTSENGYLRIGIDLGLGVETLDGEKQKPFVGRVRDTILSSLGTRTVEELLTQEGKAKLKRDILQAINERVPEIECREVYFTELLVQH